jgi:hypothetical protein
MEDWRRAAAMARKRGQTMSQSETIHHPRFFLLFVLFFMVSSVVLIDLGTATVLPSLGGGSTSTGESTEAVFAGGVSVNGSEASNNTTVKVSDKLNVNATITVDPGDVGQIADIVVVAAYTSAEGDMTLFNKMGDGSWNSWDGGIGSLEVSQADANLISTMDLSVFEGSLPFTGTLDIFLGYRLDNGTVIYNPTPINVTIADDSVEIDMGQRVSLSEVENQLLARINEERNASGLPTLVRDPGIDWIIYWHGTQMAANHFLSHTDGNGRRAEARARYYSGDSSVRCSEIIQWWGGTPSGDVHYEGYFNSPAHHSAYMEEGIYNLGPTTHVGVVALEGTGPTDSVYEGRDGSYTGVFFCDLSLTLRIDPFSED